jgi:raffinose/stachyose/melibiose transport system permease protein
MPKGVFIDKLRVKPSISGVLKYIVLFFFGITMLYPLLWTLINSFKDNTDIFRHPFSLPAKWMIDNYINAWKIGHLNVSFVNSMIVSFLTVALIILLSSMASFVLARINFKFSFAIYSFFLLGMMVPQTSVMIPLFVLYKNLGLINKYSSLIVSYTAFGISMAVFILVGFMKSIPKELEEAAIIDGCSGQRIFLTIILPLSRSALVTVAILSFLDAWNEYLFALVFIANPAVKTLSLALANFRDAHAVHYGLMSAGIVISTLPVIIIYILLQEQVIKGLTAGAVKG